MGKDAQQIEVLLAKARQPSADALRLHPLYQGKIAVSAKCPIRGLDDFAVWYTPGVAAPCREIAQQPERVFAHTNKGNFIAVVSDGTRVLGLGDIGPFAALPVMEGKALLFKYLGGVDRETKKAESVNRRQREAETRSPRMDWKEIAKPRAGWPVTPNLVDYGQTRSTFSWHHARQQLDGLPDGRGLNIAHEAVDRHAAGPRGDHLALRWLGKRGEVRDFTYQEFSRLTNRFANVLNTLGVGKGERVFLLAGRIPELYVSALGTLKNRSAFCPMFSAFGPEPIRQRLSIGDGRVLVTTAALYKRKVADVRQSLPQLQHVLLIGTPEETNAVAGTHNFHALMAAVSDQFVIQPTDPEDLALLHFTSGTTGKPKGAMHVHQAVVAHHATGTYALDFHPDDIFWCTADPGWVTGTSYGIIAPFTHGITSIVDEAEFDAERWYGILQQQKVTVWYTAPTAVRMMMKVGVEVVRKYDLSRLRFIASVGEPLNPEAQEGCSRGRGGSMHLFDAATRFYGGNAIVGGGLPVAVGLALADKLQGRHRVTACFFGEGAVAEGEFHESLNLAALWHLPVLFCCENNLYAMGTALTRSESEPDLCLKAASYEIPAWPVDGMDVVACEEAMQRAASAVRAGAGPYFLEFRTYRFRAHSMYDPQLYRDKQEIEEWKHRDPILLFQTRLQEQGLLSADDLTHLEEKVAAEVTAAVEFAEAGAWEPVEDLTKYVYSERTPA